MTFASFNVTPCGALRPNDKGNRRAAVTLAE